MNSHEAFKIKFNTQSKCVAFLEELRWGKKRQAVCIHCNSGNRMTKRGGTIIWHCNKCNLDTTVLLKSPMEHSRLPLPKWFEAIYLMLNTSKNASQIARQVGVPYKNMWYCAMRIRSFMVSPESNHEIKLELRDDLRKFMKERALSEKEETRIEGFDDTIKELLAAYNGKETDYDSVTRYLIMKLRLRYKKLSRKYSKYYIAEYVYRKSNENRRNLFGYYMANAFL